MSKKNHRVTWPRVCRNAEEAALSTTEFPEGAYRLSLLPECSTCLLRAEAPSPGPYDTSSQAPPPHTPYAEERAGRHTDSLPHSAASPPRSRWLRNAAIKALSQRRQPRGSHCRPRMRRVRGSSAAPPSPGRPSASPGAAPRERGRAPPRRGRWELRHRPPPPVQRGRRGPAAAILSRRMAAAKWI